MSTSRPFRHRLELVLFLLARAAMRTTPHPWARAVGRSFGGLLYHLDRRHRRVVDDNLSLVFPDWDAHRRHDVSRRCFRHFGAMVFDIVSLGRFDAVEICRRLTVDGWEHLDTAEAKGRGVVAFTAHVGNWEMASYPFFLYRPPLHVVVRPFNNPLVYRHMEAERRRFGQELIAKSGAAREMFRVVKRGGKVGVVMDQRVRPGQGITVPFLGHEALATPLPAAVCLRTGAPALPVFARPEPGGRYRVTIAPPIVPPADGRDDDSVAAFTRRLLGPIEDAIREVPYQWLWMHRRWRLD